MPLRLGEWLVRKGLLSRDQVQEILDVQSESRRPFGEIAENLFGLSPRDVESAWADQFAELTRIVDPCAERIEADVLRAVNRRQAWQFQVLPLRREKMDLLMVTTKENLPRATRFVAWNISDPVFFVLSDQERLVAALNAHFPMPGAASLLTGSKRKAG